MNFNLTEEQQMTRDMVKEFADKELKKRAVDIDKNEEFPFDIIKKMDDIRHIFRSTSETKKATLKEGRNFIRALVNRIKTASFYTEAIGEDLGIINISRDFNPDKFKPEVKLDRVNEGVEVNFTKGKTDGVNIYRRAADNGDWSLVARRIGRIYPGPLCSSGHASMGDNRLVYYV